MVKLTYIPSAMYENSSCLHTFANIWFYPVLLILAILWWYHIMVLTYVFLIRWLWALFHILIGHLNVFFFVKCLFQVFPFFHWIGSLFPLTCASLHVLEKSLIMEGSRVGLGREAQRKRHTERGFLFPVYHLPFQSLNVVFWWTVLHFNEPTY